MGTATRRGVCSNSVWRRSRLKELSAFIICLVLTSSFLMFTLPALAAASINLDIPSGPAGTVVTVTGGGFTASSYGYVYFDSNNNGIRDSGELSQFVGPTSGAGDLPAGVTLTVPALAPGDYDVIANIPTGEPLVDAAATFTLVSAVPVISLNPASGYPGTVITVTGGSFTPDSAGYIWFDTDDDGLMDVEEPQAGVTSTAGGAVPAGVTLTAPSAPPGDYRVRADIPSGDSVEAEATFSYIVLLSLSPDTGTEGTEISVTGTGFSASASGYVWFDTDADTIRDAGEPQASVTSTAGGDIPAGITLTVPSVAPIISYQVLADIPEGSPIEASAAFTTTATTLRLTVTKYDAYENIVDTATIDYTAMESALPVQGLTLPNRYHQGPSFADSSLNALWDPGETVNLDKGDYGRVKGTDVKDLCNLVGGAAAGDAVRIVAPDNFAKWFDYEDIYHPEPEQGRLVVCWYNQDYGGYVPDYTTGMRLIFFAETLNPEDKYVFGNWDMHETLPASRWHFYVDSKYWPSSSGLSVQNVYRIDIYQPKLVSCNASGAVKDSFTPGETVYVKGLGLAGSSSYKIWVQGEPVLEKPLDSLDRPGSGAYVYSPVNDPSGAQETVTTNANGDFNPTAVWVIGPSEPAAKYDIAADSQSRGTVGSYDGNDAIDNPGWKGFEVSGAPQVISFTITDYNDDGINFGFLAGGAADRPADWSGGLGAVTITVGVETNVDVIVQVKADDFVDVETIPIGNVKYDSDDNPAGARTLTTSYVTWYTVDAPLVTDHVTQVYYWITIPADADDGDYTSTFYYKAESTTP